MVEYMTENSCNWISGDNFAAGMTGGMAFIYDKNKEFEKSKFRVSCLQKIETDYWKSYLRGLF